MSQAHFESFSEVVRSHARTSPHRAAFVVGSRRVGWAELDRNADRIASQLRESGLRPRDRVAALLSDPVEFLFGLFGTVRASGVYVPLPGRLQSEALREFLRDCRPRFVLSDGSVPRLRGVTEQGFGTHVPVAASPFSAKTVRKRSSVRAEDEFSILYTSGSTAQPKGIVHTHGARYFSARRDVAHFRLCRESVALVATPLYTSMTWSVILPVVLAGGTSVIVEPFTPGAIADVLRVERVTLMKLVPTQYAMLLEDRAFPMRSLETLEWVLYSGAQASEKTKVTLRRLFPSSATEVYGASECGPITYLQAHLAGKCGVGVPFPSVRIRILDERGDVVPPAGGGAIAVSSPGLMLGYHRNAAATRAAFWTEPSTGRRFCRVGDIGSLDGQGCLWLGGRADDVIMSGGLKIHARDIEQVLLRHEDVVEAAVVGAPHRLLGESPVAFVVLRSGGSVDCAMLCAWTNARLNWYQRLQCVTRLDRLPTKSAGKVAKDALKRRHRRR